jgi:hypothetical protein
MLVLGKRAIVQAAAELLLERDRFGLAGVFSAAAFLTTSDFDVEPVLRLRPGLASDLEAVSVEAEAVGAVAGPTFALAFAFALALTL